MLVAVALVACSSPTPPPAPSIAPAPKGPTAKESYELRERCAKDAMVWFKQNHPESQDDPISVKGGGSISSTSPTYQNHYSNVLNGCFALVYQMMSFQNSAQPSPKHAFVQSNTLWDVNENTQLGAYVVKNLKEMTACDVRGTKCTSKEQWMELAKNYMLE